MRGTECRLGLAQVSLEMIVSMLHVAQDVNLSCCLVTHPTATLDKQNYRVDALEELYEIWVVRMLVHSPGMPLPQLSPLVVFRPCQTHRFHCLWP